ncbi:GumC family protein [Pararhizobium sp.]|uniref:GumC family protein n=1 Tax=Pararhizobium sp. TaxID=1977563 RepID=UPI002722F167|nr:GumC family protein [Pararhizobium sp.]MDO9418268.1 GumC family protein [Pararhizobium sp.]
MFDPDDKKRTPRGRSLLDLVPAQGETRLRAADRAAQQHSLLDQLDAVNTSSRAGRGPKVSIGTARQPVDRQDEAASKPGIRARLTDWMSNATGNEIRPALQPGTPVREARQATVANAVLSTAGDGGSSGQDRPLIDLGLVIQSVWRLRLLVAVLTILGAVAGVMMAMGTPNKYISESRLYADPREVRLTDSDLSSQALSTEAILAIIDSQMQVLTSGKVLEKVSSELGLERDPEFNGRSPPTGISAGLTVLREIIFGRRAAEAPSDDTQFVLEHLRDAVKVSRDEKTFVIALSVTTRDAAKSALIANKLVATFLEEESDAQSGFFKRTTTALDGRIAELRKDLDLAETAVEKYKADNDIVGASGKLISENQLVTLNDQVGAAGNRVAETRAKADTLAGVRLDDVLSGASPEDVNSPTLSELRKQYATARAEFGSLSTRLGPRHPQRVAAEQSLSTIRSEIQNELRRIAASAQTEFQRAVETQADLARQLAVQKARQVNSSTDFVKLRELERTATATRVIYESFLKRALETGEEQKLTSRNFRVISQASPALQPSGASRKVIAIGGMLAGLFGGIGLGVLIGVYRSLLGASAGGRRQTDFVYDDTPDDRPPNGGPRGTRRDGYDDRNGHPAGSGNWQGLPSTYGDAGPATIGMHYKNESGYPGLDDGAPSHDGRPARAPHLPLESADDRRAQHSARHVLYEREQTPAATAQSSDGMRRVHDDLKSLRARVERYALQNKRTNFSGR